MKLCECGCGLPTTVYKGKARRFIHGHQNATNPVFKSMTCFWCGTAIPKPTHNQKALYYQKGHMFCSKACSGARVGAVSSKTMADTNRKYASARMVLHNPMHDAAIRQSVSDTLKRIGHKPSVRGGNGTGLTAAEQVLSTTTGLLPYVVVTHMKRNSGYPTNYKLDLADPQRKLGIEIDGNSHCLLSRQAQDRKKEEFLKTLGWTVLRFSNKQALEETEECVRIIQTGG